MALSPSHAQWLKQERGITKATATAFKLDTSPDGALCLPYPAGPKRRYGIPDGKRRFIATKGAPLQLFRRPGDDLASYETVFICEGETDAMRLWQGIQATDTRTVGVCSLPGAGTWKDEWAEELHPHAAHVFVVLDNDDDYQTRKLVEKTWRTMRHAIGAAAHRLCLPPGVKDLCEFFAEGYTIQDIGVLCRTENKWNINYADLSDLQLTTETDWLVDGILAKGDVGLLTGDSGAGKSYLSMDLALAVIQGRPWLGQRVLDRGVACIIDEENPLNLVKERLLRLGLGDDHKQLRYASMQNLLLERDADMLIDDMTRMQPKLVVFDTWASLSNATEYDVKEVGRVFREVLMPIAQETNAVVLQLHHSTKPTSNPKMIGSATSRVRGSGAFKANADSAIEISGRISEKAKLEHFKCRRAIPLAAKGVRMLTSTFDHHVSFSAWPWKEDPA